MGLPLVRTNELKLKTWLLHKYPTKRTKKEQKVLYSRIFSTEADSGIHLKQQCCALLYIARALNVHFCTLLHNCLLSPVNNQTVTSLLWSVAVVCSYAKHSIQGRVGVWASQETVGTVLGLRYDVTKACPLRGGIKINSRKVTNDQAKTYAVHFNRS